MSLIDDETSGASITACARHDVVDSWLIRLSGARESARRGVVGTSPSAVHGGNRLFNRATDRLRRMLSARHAVASYG